MAKQNRATKSMPLLQTIHKTKMTTPEERKRQCAEATMRYYWKNKEKVLAYHKEYRARPEVKERESQMQKHHRSIAEIKEMNKQKRKAYALLHPEVNKIAKKKYLSNPENKRKAREYRIRYDLKKKYDITLEQYNYLLNIQNYCCAICNDNLNTLNKKFIHVDHSHSTNKVRGILCTNCNTGLGLFNDDKQLFYRAIEYLEKTEKKEG